MDPIEILATLGVVAVVVKGVVDAIRRRYPLIDGGIVQLLAIVLGVGVAWGFDLKATAALLEQAGAAVGRVPIAAVDYVITGVAIAFSAGFFAEVSGRSGNGALLVEVDSEGKHL